MNHYYRIYYFTSDLDPTYSNRDFVADSLEDVKEKFLAAHLRCTITSIWEQIWTRKDD